MTKGYDLNIIDVIPNNALTVYNVIWDLSPDPNNYQKFKKNPNINIEGDFETIQKRLQKVLDKILKKIYLLLII